VVEDSERLSGGARLKRLWRARPNNGMHPTGKSANVIRKIESLRRFFPAGDAGR